MRMYVSRAMTRPGQFHSGEVEAIYTRITQRVLPALLDVGYLIHSWKDSSSSTTCPSAGGGFLDNHYTLTAINNTFASPE